MLLVFLKIQVYMQNSSSASFTNLQPTYYGKAWMFWDLIVYMRALLHKLFMTVL